MDEVPKVVSLFSRAPIVSAPEPVPTASVALAEAMKKKPVDQKSVASLNLAIEEVLKGDLSGVMIVGTETTTGEGAYYISFPEGTSQKVESLRYIGLVTILKAVLVQAATGSTLSEEE